MTLANSITFAAAQGQSTLTIAAPSVSQTLTVVNPCAATTINQITFSPSAIAVNDGDDGPADFVIPTDAVDVANSLTGLCGARSYAIKDATNVAVTTWAVITDHASTEGSMTLTIKTSLYPNQITTATKVETLTITTTLVDWSGATASTTNIVVTISRLACNCDRLLWVAPTLQTVTVNIGATKDLTVANPGDGTAYFPAASPDSATTASTFPDFNACIEASTPCSTTGGSYSASNVKYEATPGASVSALPSSPSTWLAFTDGT